jgi:predicted Rossmann-fold nucleotide-binding protein
MIVIIAGSRNFTDYETLKEAIKESGFQIHQIVSGGANGVDALGERYAKENGIDLVVFKADWDKWGKAAGPKRNKHMAEYADALIALYDGESKGTTNMIHYATRCNLYIHIKKIPRTV